MSHHLTNVTQAIQFFIDHRRGLRSFNILHPLFRQGRESAFH